MPSRSASARASPTGRTLKARITALEAAARITSDSVMRPTPRWVRLTETSFWGSLAISSSTASTEPDTSPLSTRLSSLTAPSWASLKTSSSEILRPERRASASVFRRVARWLPGLRPRRRHAVEAEHLDRLAGPGRFRTRAEEVVHRPHPPDTRAGDQRVADVQRAARDEQR